MKRAYFQTKRIALQFIETVRKTHKDATVGIYDTGYIVVWL